MSLVKWNPESSIFPSITGWMDDFFNDNTFRPAVKGISIPAVNVSESKKAYKLDVAAPGFKKDEFKLEIQHGYLTISGESNEEKEDKDEKMTRREYAFNQFSRSFSLPENVDTDAISAQYADGVLKVTLPKKTAEGKATKKISVE